MHHAGLVRRDERPTRREQDADGELDVEPGVRRQVVGERDAVGLFGHVVGASVGDLTDIDDVDRTRMRDGADDARDLEDAYWIGTEC
jgi:hypothetical protein